MFRSILSKPWQTPSLKYSTQATPKTGIVLMNLGGPGSLNEVEDFLTRLFSDPDLIPLPYQSRLAPMISRFRTKKIQQQYHEIGGGSPIRSWTEKQGKLLEELLNQLNPSTAPHKTYIAFRYAKPLTEDAIDHIIKDNVKRVIAFTQYPQYSCSTTGSSLNELWRKLTVMDPNRTLNWSVIDRWSTHPGLVEAFAKIIQDCLNNYLESERKNAVILFTAHSLPMSVVNRGDPYPAEVAATVHRVMEYLGYSNPYRLVWQSRVGPSAWLGPQTDQAIEGLAKNGHKNVILVPIAFTSDHIETLFELDLEYVDLAKKLGVTGVQRAPALNCHPSFIQAMADLVISHLNSPLKVSNQLPLQCPLCTKLSCRQAKDYFSK